MGGEGGPARFSAPNAAHALSKGLGPEPASVYQNVVGTPSPMLIMYCTSSAASTPLTAPLGPTTEKVRPAALG